MVLRGDRVPSQELMPPAPSLLVIPSGLLPLAPSEHPGCYSSFPQTRRKGPAILQDRQPALEGRERMWEGLEQPCRFWEPCLGADPLLPAFKVPGCCLLPTGTALCCAMPGPGKTAAEQSREGGSSTSSPRPGPEGLTGREGWLLCHPVHVMALRLPVHPRRLNLDGEGSGHLLTRAGRERRPTFPRGKGFLVRGEQKRKKEGLDLPTHLPRPVSCSYPPTQDLRRIQDQ